MENTEKTQEQAQTIDPASFAGSAQGPSAPPPPPQPDFDYDMWSNMVFEISATALANDLPLQYWNMLPSPQYLKQFYKMIQLERASGYLNFVNPDPKQILIFAGIGTAAYIGWMGLTVMKIKKELGPQRAKKAAEQAGMEKKREYEEMARQMKEQQEKQMKEQQVAEQQEGGEDHGA